MEGITYMHVMSTGYYYHWATKFISTKIHLKIGVNKASNKLPFERTNMNMMSYVQKQDLMTWLRLIYYCDIFIHALLVYEYKVSALVKCKK